jgi:surface protein
MKTTIIARDKEHLKSLIDDEIKKNGWESDLNHIDVSNITDMSSLFKHHAFNGDISKWDVSNVVNMSYMFYGSYFNGNISNWNVSKVQQVVYIFYNSHFTNDLNNWEPYQAKNVFEAFQLARCDIPYWASYDDLSQRKKAIDTYQLNKQLNDSLSKNGNTAKRVKI